MTPRADVESANEGHLTREPLCKLVLPVSHQACWSDDNDSLGQRRTIKAMPQKRPHKSDALQSFPKSLHVQIGIQIYL